MYASSPSLEGETQQAGHLLQVPFLGRPLHVLQMLSMIGEIEQAIFMHFSSFPRYQFTQGCSFRHRGKSEASLQYDSSPSAATPGTMVPLASRCCTNFTPRIPGRLHTKSIFTHSQEEVRCPCLCSSYCSFHVALSHVSPCLWSISWGSALYMVAGSGSFLSALSVTN